MCTFRIMHVILGTWKQKTAIYVVQYVTVMNNEQSIGVCRDLTVLKQKQQHEKALFVHVIVDFNLGKWLH
jgi:hypothetical protein